MRVAAFPQYSIPEKDVLILLHYSQEKQTPFLKVLPLVSEIPDLSEEAKKGLTLLDTHLQGLCYGTEAWWLLVNYLFIRSYYLKPILADSSYQGQQRRLAIYQFLEFAAGQYHLSSGEKDPKEAFLDNVRRLEILGEEKQQRQLPDVAKAIDAVRLMTIHASKGLEFSAVYLPGLGKGQFPAKRRPHPCPPPPGLAPWMGENELDEEEECLFFVGLSRAIDTLCLSRPSQVNGRKSNPSDLLDPIAPVLPHSPDGSVTWISSEPAIPPEIDDLQPPDPLPVFDKGVLDVYLRCPKRFQFQVIMGLNGGADDSAFLNFHRCLHHVLQWAEQAGLSGKTVDHQDLLSQLDVTWQANGPVGHPFESIYRKNAETMVTNAFQRGMFSHRSIPVEPLKIPLEFGIVSFTPDHIELQEDGSRIIRRTRTGRISKSEKDDDAYGLYHAAATMQGDGKSADVQVFWLSTGDIEVISLNDKTAVTRQGHYNTAIRGILQGKYPPRPKGERDCPRCAYYFICQPEDEE